MTRRLLFFICFLIPVITCQAQSTWTRTYGDHLQSIVYGMAKSNDNGYLLAGTTNAHGPSGYGSTLLNPLLVKTDSAGNMIWQKVFGSNNSDYALDVVQVPNGDIFLLGYTSLSYSDENVVLTKLDQNGNLIWQQNYGGPNRDRPGKIVADGNDVVFTVTLDFADYGATPADIQILKVNNSGSTVWAKTYGTASAAEIGYGIIKLHDGGFLISGQSRTGSNNTGYAIRTNSNGDTLWTRIVSSIGISNHNIGLWDCTQLAGDTVLVLVGSSPSTYDNLCVVKMDLNGNVLNTFISSFLSDVATDVEPLDNGGYIVAGAYANFGGVAALYRFDPMGNSYIWHKRYFGMGGSSYYSYSHATCVIPDDDGGFVLGGSVSIFSPEYTKNKMLLMKTDGWGNAANYGSVIPTVSQPDTVCAGTSITISVPDVFDHYQWFWYNNNNKLYWVPDSDTSSIEVDSSRYYRCVMWNDDGEYIISQNAVTIVSNFPDSTITNVGYPNFCPPSNNLRVDYEPGTIISWFCNGNLLSSTIPGYLTPSVSGTYYAQLSNACTTLTTAPVNITVGQPSFNIGPDTVHLKYYNGASGGCYPVRLNAGSSGGSIYSWFHNGVQLPNTTSYLDPVTQGYYYATVSNSCGLTYTDTTWVVYDTVFSHLVHHPSYSLTGCNNRYLELRVDNFYYSQDVLLWNWYKNGVLVAQQFNGDPSAGSLRPGNVTFGNALDSGYFYCIVTDTCGSLSFNHATDSVYYIEDQSSTFLSVVGGGQPINCFGNSITISANQTNATYQWYKDSVLMPGATAQQLVVTASGNYYCGITRPCGQYNTSNLRVWIGTPPGIIISDFSGICHNGTDTTKVRLQPQTPSYVNTYQWRLNGVNIPGATGSYYETKIPGVYDCILSYPCDTLYSNQITLNTYYIPTTLTSDNFGRMCPGGTVELQAAPGYSYQWYKRVNWSEQLIPGATDSIYLADSATDYRVKISNGFCSLNSEYENVNLQNPPAPNFILPTTPPLSCAGGPVNLVANTRPDFSYQWMLNGLPIPGATSPEYLASGSGVFTVVLSDSIGCESVSEPLSVDDSFSSNISLNLTSLSNQCAGDTITISVNGTYQSYQWYCNNVPIPGAVTPNLVTDSSGIYSVLVTENTGCAGTAHTSVSFVPAPAISNFVSSPSFCSLNNGSFSLNFSSPVDISVSGPTAIPSQIGVSSVVNNSLSPGWYYLTYGPTGGNCTFIDSIEVLSTGNIPVQINAGTGSICQGQYINAGSGTTGYQISWNTGQTTYSIQPPATGWYVLTLTDTSTGCSGVDSAFVTVNALPSVSIQPPGPLVICGPGSVNLDAGSGFGQYLWSNGQQTQTITTSFSGNYIVTVTDLNGCTNRDTVVVTSQPLPSLTNTANGPTSFCVGGSVQLSVAGSAGSLQWHRYNIPISGATSSTHTVTVAGSYRCLVTDAFGCTAFSNPITVTTPCQPPQDPVDKLTTGNADNESISVFPNPGSGLFNIVIPESITAAEFKLFDLSGREILRQGLFQQIDHDLFLLDLLSAKAGVYYMTLMDISGNVYRQRIVKL